MARTATTISMKEETLERITELAEKHGLSRSAFYEQVSETIVSNIDDEYADRDRRKELQETLDRAEELILAMNTLDGVDSVTSDIDDEYTEGSEESKSDEDYVGTEPGEHTEVNSSPEELDPDEDDSSGYGSWENQDQNQDDSEDDEFHL